MQAQEQLKAYNLVTFSLANEVYGVEINSVQEIIRATEITAVPGAPPHIRGVINLRGKIVAVTDLRRRFGLPEGEVTDAVRIIVLDLGAKWIGMLVDGVSQVIKVSSLLMEEIPEEVANVDDRYLKGIAKLEQRLIIVLDLRRSLLA